MLSKFSIDFAINVYICLPGIFLTEEEEGGLPLIGVDNNFLMSPGLSLLAILELTKKVDSLLSISFSATIEAYSE